MYFCVFEKLKTAHFPELRTFYGGHYKEQLEWFFSLRFQGKTKTTRTLLTDSSTGDIVPST